MADKKADNLTDDIVIPIIENNFFTAQEYENMYEAAIEEESDHLYVAQMIYKRILEKLPLTESQKMYAEIVIRPAISDGFRNAFNGTQEKFKQEIKKCVINVLCLI